MFFANKGDVVGTVLSLKKLFSYVLDSSPRAILAYIKFFSWLLRDSLWRNKKMTFLVLVTGILGVAFQVKVFALIIYYAKHFSSGDMISIWRHEVDPRDSIALLASMSLAVFVLLLLTGLSVYVSRRCILRLGRRYGEFCAKRVFSLLDSRFHIVNFADNSSTVDIHILRLVSADSMYCNRILTTLLSLVVPVLTLTVAGATLFYLEPLLTCILMIFLTGFVFIQAMISRKTSFHSVQYEAERPLAGRDYRRIIQHFKYQPESRTGQEIISFPFKAGAIRRYLDAYEGILSSVENSKFASMMLMAFMMGLIILVMGGNIIRAGSGWGRLLIYIVALRFAITNLESSFTILTSINRFYPLVRRYFLFVHSFCRVNEINRNVKDRYELVVSGNQLNGSQERVVLRRGLRLGLVSSEEVNRYTIPTLIESLLSPSQEIVNGALSSLCFATTRHARPLVSLRDFLKLDASSKWKDLETFSMDEELLVKTRELVQDDLDRQIDPEMWEDMEPKFKFSLSLFSTINRDCRWVLIEAIGLNLLDKQSSKVYLNLLRGKIVVLIFSEDLSQVGTFNEDVLAVINERELIGLGSMDWFGGVRRDVAAMLGIEDQEEKGGRHIVETVDDEFETDI